MAIYGAKSKEKLATCHRDLQIVGLEVIKSYEHSIICGYRSPEDQLIAYNSGNSQIKFGKHNTKPSEAFDVAPFVDGRLIMADPVSIKKYISEKFPQESSDKAWFDKAVASQYQKELYQIYNFAGFVLGAAGQQGIKLRWGGDWNKDRSIFDNKFNDLYHFELVLE